MGNCALRQSKSLSKSLEKTGVEWLDGIVEVKWIIFLVYKLNKNL